MFNLINRNRIKDPIGDRIFMTINYIFLIAILLTVFYPLLYIVSSSFSSSRAVTSGQVWLFPVDFNIKAYISIFKSCAPHARVLQHDHLHRGWYVYQRGADGYASLPALP